MLFGDCFPILSCDRNCLSLKHTIYRNLTQFFCTFKIHFLQQNVFLPSGQRRAAFSPGICPLVYDWQVPSFDGWPFPWISAELRQRVQIPALCGGPGTRQRDKHSEFWGALLLARSECSCGLWNCISSSCLEVWPASTVKVCLDGNLAPLMLGKTFLMKETAGHGPWLWVKWVC